MSNFYTLKKYDGRYYFDDFYLIKKDNVVNKLGYLSK